MSNATLERDEQPAAGVGLALSQGQQYQFFAPLPEDDFQALKEDIAARGVQVPVVVDEAGNILDGFHRVRACEELGVKDYPRLVCTGLSHDQKVEQALTLNLLRRHLTPEQRADVTAKLRREGWSTRRIADKLQVSDTTVRRDLEGATNVAPQTVTGKDGKSYPASIITRTASEHTRVQRALALVSTDPLPQYSVPLQVFNQAKLEMRRRRIDALG